MKNPLHILSLSLTAVFNAVFASQLAMPAPDLEPLCEKPYQGPQNKTVRSIFGITNCEVRAYPSLGGIVRKSLTAAELPWLGLSRSQPSDRSPDPQIEDEFAFQLLRLGARWWKSLSFYRHRSGQVEGGYPWPDSYPPMLYIGYPSTGGVWVLAVRKDGFLPMDWARVEMAFTMDERCAMLEAVGATFYAVVDDCSDIAKSLEDGVAIGRMWEERMKEIDA